MISKTPSSNPIQAFVALSLNSSFVNSSFMLRKSSGQISILPLTCISTILPFARGRRNNARCHLLLLPGILRDQPFTPKQKQVNVKYRREFAHGRRNRRENEAKASSLPGW